MKLRILDEEEKVNYFEIYKEPLESKTVGLKERLIINSMVPEEFLNIIIEQDINEHEYGTSISLNPEEAKRVRDYLINLYPIEEGI